MEAPWHDSVNRAIACEDRGELSEAVEIMRDAVERFPSVPDVWLHLGRLQLESGHSAGAERAGRIAVALNPDFVNGYWLLGSSLRRQGRNLEAVDAFTRYAALRPWAGAFIFLGDACAAAEDLVAAEEALKKALELDATNEEAMYHLALICTRDRSDVAIEYFEKALAIDPQYVLAHRDLGTRLLHLGRLEEAEKSLRRAAALCPEDIWTHMWLGHALWRQDREEEALEEFITATRVQPRCSAAHMALAGFYWHLERIDDADRHYRLSLECDPDAAVALVEYAKFLWAQERDEEARQMAARALELDPDNGKLRQLWREMRDEEQE